MRVAVRLPLPAELGAVMRRAARALKTGLPPCLVLAVALLAGALAHADPLGLPSHLAVVVEADHPPFAFTDADGQLRGYSVDLWQLFEKRTGIAVDLKVLPSAAAQQALQLGHADVMAAVQHTPEHDGLYDYDAAHLPVANSIYVGGDILGVTDPATLRGFEVAVEDGSACLHYLRSAGIGNLKLYPGNQDVINAVVRRDERVFCMDDYAARYYLGRSQQLKDFNKAFTLHHGELHRVVAKGRTDLLNLVQWGMSQVAGDEQRALQARWLKPPGFFAEHARLIYSAVAAVVALFALLGSWVYLLRRAVERRTREVLDKQQNLRSIFDGLQDLILIKDAQGVIVESNRAVILAFDGVVKPLKGRRAHEILAPQDAAALTAAEIQVMASGGGQVFTVERLLDGGQVASEEIYISPRRDPAGAIIGTVSVVHDITHRLKMQGDLRLWAHAVQQADFGVQILDIQTRTIVAVNEQFARERGYTAQEMQGMPFAALFPSEVALAQERAVLAIGQAEHQIVETEHLRRHGGRFPVLLDRSVYRDAHGQARYVVVYAQDITERRRAQAEQRLAAVAFETQDATLVLDGTGLILRANQAFAELTGYVQADLLGCEPFFLQTQASEQGLPDELRAQVCRQKGWKGQLWLQPRTGKPRVVRANVSAVQDKDSEQASHFVCALIDVTGEREAHARAKRLTFFDALTNLPNRNHLFGQIAHIVQGAGSRSGVLLVIDLDHFKRVNELQGHAAGDELLVLIARRLRELLGAHDSLARLSGGVFAWLMACDGEGGGEGEGTSACAIACARVAERVRAALGEEPFALTNGEDVQVTASMGWCAFDADGPSPEEIFKRAEMAMYAAKADGRDRVRHFEPGMLEELARREALLDELRDALAQPDGGGLQLHAQPKFDPQGQVHSAELLLRWRRRDGQMCAPDQFIALAEQNGLIEPLGTWVLQQACRQLAQWAPLAHAQGVSLAVNVSAHQFVQPSFVALVRQVLAAHRAPPQRLILEITESALLGDLKEVAARLHELRELGVRVSLDDFGTGYSSLSYLSRLPIDELKIDRSFVMRLPSEAVDVTVAQTVIAMARGLGLQVVAEGVETTAQRDWLLRHGCHLLQGYLLARPMPLLDCEHLLRERTGTGAIPVTA